MRFTRVRPYKGGGSDLRRKLDSSKKKKKAAPIGADTKSRVDSDSVSYQKIQIQIYKKSIRSLRSQPPLQKKVNFKKAFLKFKIKNKFMNLARAAAIVAAERRLELVPLG